MGTNYYLSRYGKNEHIGKSVGIGNNETCFLWAINPNELKQTLRYVKCHACEHIISIENKIIENDIGEQFTLEEFLRKIKTSKKESFEFIGTDFC